MADRTFSRICTVAWREFRYTALTKSFLVGAVAIPVIMLGVIAVLPPLMVSQLKPLEGRVAVVDPTGRFETAFDLTLEARRDQGLPREVEDGLAEFGLDPATELMGKEMLAGARADNLPKVEAVTIADDTSIDDLKTQSREGDWIGVAVIPPEQLEPRSGSEDFAGQEDVELFVPTEISHRNASDLRNLLRDSVVRARFDGEAAEYGRVKAMLDRPSVDVVRLGQSGAEAQESKLKMIFPFGFMMLLWIATLTAGNYLLTSTIEEKSNKVIEVVLSAVGPLELLWGKILGLAMVSLVIVLTYGGLAIAGLVALAMTDLISFSMLLWCALFFVIAYLMIAALMSAVGSAVSDLREAQSLIGPVMIILVIPMLLSAPITENPNGPLAVIASMLPPILPFAMVMRLGAATEPIPIWQLCTSGLIGIVSVLLLVWAASRVFRIGILMQGKAPSPLELLRWIRQA
ncbi:MAG: ABC transporter permease [Phycisphaera sp.]|nr:ABC transporter permease [Phycisphaera sp.]